MAITITNSIGQHNIPQKITQKQNIDLSCHTGSCMAHLNCLPPRAASVNFWFFIAVPFGGGCWYKAKYGMRDAATQDRRWNERVKLWIFRKMETVATCSMTDGNGSYHGLAPSFFEEMTRCRRQNHCQRWPGNSNCPSEFRKISRVPSSFMSVCVYAIATVVLQLTATAVATHPHRRISKRWYVADVKTSLEMTRQP